MPAQPGAEELVMAVSQTRPPAHASSLRVLRGLADEQLTELVAAGSEQAFSVIYDRYMPALLRYCRRILPSSADADDAAQTAMVRAMSAMSQRPPRHLRPWLYRIAHNEAVTLARGHVNAARAETAADREQADPAPEPIEAAATRARLAQLLADLHALPGRQRDALVMRELCGRSYADIASELGMNEKAAQQAVFDARMSLHDYSAGRELDCLSVQRSLSEREHARVRSRRVRAHLRECELCASFERGLYARRRDYALLLPWVAPASIPEILGLGAAGGGAGEEAAHAFSRMLRTPIPPGGLRAAAGVAAIAAALGAGGVALHGSGHRPERARATTARDVSIQVPSLKGDAQPRRGTGERSGATPPPGHVHAKGKLVVTATPAQTATEGGQTRVPGSPDGAAGSAASGGGSNSGAAAGQSRGGHGAGTGLPIAAPGAHQSLGAVGSAGSTVVNDVAGAVNGATGAVQNAAGTAAGSASQTGSSASGTVTTAVNGATGAVQKLP